MDTNQQQNISKQKTSSNWINWLLWWQIGKDELQNQVQNYNTLKYWQSARGLSALFLTFSAVINILFMFSGMMASLVLIDTVLFLVLAYFIYYKSAKWAMITAMILWTFEKFYPLVYGINPTIVKVSQSSLIVGILFWLVYMHAFYLAYKVEVAREKQNTPQQTQNTQQTPQAPTQQMPPTQQSTM